MKSPEKFEREPSLKETVRINFEKFLKLSDEPGEYLSTEQKIELIKRIDAGDKEARKIFEENKDSKYRTNSLSGALMWGDYFLKSNEADGLPEKEKKELSERTEAVMKRVYEMKGSPIPKELVEEVINIVNEIKKYL